MTIVTKNLDLGALSEVLENVPVHRYTDTVTTQTTDFVAVEVPVALEFNGISHAVMLASPCDLKDFALGFSLTEGILKKPSELYDCEVIQSRDGLIVQLEISSERFLELKERRRNLIGRTGCGLCGVETIDQAVRHPNPIQHLSHLSDQCLLSGMQKMLGLQAIHHYTGATHAAAWMDRDGEIVAVREDVGRHNALDKLIGFLAENQQDYSKGAALISSRASFEMVQKSATMGIGILAAVSAPTSLAVKLAIESRLTLLGYVRQNSYVTYSCPERIITNNI